MRLQSCTTALPDDLVETVAVSVTPQLALRCHVAAANAEPRRQPQKRSVKSHGGDAHKRHKG
jgi:hypothetical protein|eukprot:SAG25_NODE_2111_length_1934_cov_1.313896_2_plen_62_part_00